MTIHRSAIRIAFLLLIVAHCVPTSAQEFLPSWQSPAAPGYLQQDARFAPGYSSQYSPAPPAYQQPYAPSPSAYSPYYGPSAPAYSPHYDPPAPIYPPQYSQSAASYPTQYDPPIPLCSSDYAPRTAAYPTHYAPPGPAYPEPFAEPVAPYPLSYAEPVPGTTVAKQACDSCCSACPRVYGNVEFLFLQRINCSSNQPIIESFDGIVPETFFSTSDLNFDFEPAMRATIGYRLHDGWALEASYFGLFEASANAFLVPPDGNTILSFSDGLGTANVFSDMDRIWIDYSTAIHSGELNMVCCTGCCSHGQGKSGYDPKHADSCGLCCRTFEWFVGFRYFNLSERLRIDAERDQETESGATEIESGFYDISTRNNLYGPQIGARVRRWNERLGWEATGKLGAFYNDARQRQNVVDFPDFELRPPGYASGGQFAYMGELGIAGLFRLNDVWNLRAGYNVIYIGGVALATEQMDFSGDFDGGNRLDRTGGVFLHGVSLGIEARW